jgi:seryl-tRNA synthetase
MLDIKFIRENPDLIRKTGIEKNFPINVERLLELDGLLRDKNAIAESMRAERNSLSSEIPTLNGDEKNKKVAIVKEIKDRLATVEAEIAPLKAEFDDLMYRVPNPTLPEVPVGKTDADNVELRKWGTIKEFDFEPKSHIELGESLDLMDFTRASKIAGSRTYYLKNEAVLLEMAITRFVIDKLVSKGFTPMTVPVMVKDIAMAGTGYFPLGKEQAYAITEDELYLVGTSEVSLVSYHNGETFDVSELPKFYAGFSQCFRREAGTYGKDTKGLYRVHQFTKI